MTSLMGRISMNGVPRATASTARGKRSIGAKLETVVQPRWRNVPPSPQITCAFGKLAARLRKPISRRTAFRSSCPASSVSPVRRSSLCRDQEAAVARSTRKTPVCMGMPFIRNGRPEPGPDPSEGPQRPSSVSHKTRRTLSLFVDQTHETPNRHRTVLVRRDQNFHRAHRLDLWRLLLHEIAQTAQSARNCQRLRKAC